MSNQDVIARLSAAREDLINDASTIMAAAAEANRDLLPEEEDRLTEIKADAEKRAARISQLEEHEVEVVKAAEARSKYDGVLTSQGIRVEPGRSEELYRPDGNYSFFRDIAAAQRGDIDAATRLSRHNQIQMSQRPELRMEMRDGTTGATSLGGFIPPKWLVERTALLARSGRVVADLIPDAGPPTAPAMSVPRITTGLLVAAQNGENVAITDNDLVTDSLTRTTRTIAGKTDASLQSVELSPAATDTIIYNDLRGAYNAELERQLITGTNASGELLGIINVSGTNAITYTDATPTVAELYPKIADAIQQIDTQRFMSAEAMVMHPRRWGWFTAALDTANRPLVVPTAVAMNPIATLDRIVPNGLVGQIQGVDAYKSPGMPTNLGTNEDEIAVFRPSDMVKFEGALRFESSRDAGFNTLSVAFRVYAFVCFFPDRYPKSISEINGTGLIAPTF